MRKIAVLSQKGGVGKTTTAVNIAAGLAREEKKVLLIDLDAQGHVSTCFKSVPMGKTVQNILADGTDINECITHLGKNLDIIASTGELLNSEPILVHQKNPEHILAKRFAKVKGYDYVILDCPPSLTLLTRNALLFADEAFLISTTDVLSVDALIKGAEFIEWFKKSYNHHIKITNVIPTMFDKRNKVCRLMLAKMQNEFYDVVTDPIRANAKIKEAPLAGKSIFAYAKTSSGAKDYSALVKSIIMEESKYDSSVSEAKQAVSTKGIIAS